MKVYADNAATTKLDIDAFQAMKPFLLDEYGNASQPYLFSRKPKQALKEARETIAKCINALPEEIYFTSGGTESDNWAIKGVAWNKRTDGVFITTQIEHHAVLKACQDVEKLGTSVMYLPVSSDGRIAIETLKNVISQDVHLVSIMFANNEIGTIEPIRELCNISHIYGALFHTDAVQAVGHVHIDVKELGIDLLSASAHKFNGPKGVGFLYIKKGTPIMAYASGGSQELGLRAGTENIASIVGMAVALKKSCDAIDEMSKYLQTLEDKLISQLAEANLDFIRNGSDNHIPGNISLSFRGADGETILHRLDLMGICVSTGAACDNKNTRLSHVLNAIKLDDNYARGTIRISLGTNNTVEDVELIVHALLSILK